MLLQLIDIDLLGSFNVFQMSSLESVVSSTAISMAHDSSRLGKLLSGLL